MAALTCGCGTALTVAEADFGKDQACPACRAVFRAVWALDPRSGEKVARRISGVRIPPGSFEVRCPCGQPRRGIDRNPEQRYDLKPIAVLAGGFEPQSLELAGDVDGR